VIEIVEATNPERIDHVKALIEEYMAWDIEVTRTLGLDTDLLLETYYSNVAELPGPYARPDGRLVLALDGVEAAGCGALRRLAADTGEVGRMFVRPRFRGRKIGRRLIDTLIDGGREVGYSRLRLATGTFMTAAHEMYRAAGFRDTEPYLDLAPGFREITMYMELDLR